MGRLSQVLGPALPPFSRECGFCLRRSKLSASAFVAGLVFGWLQDSAARVCDLSAAIALAGAAISPQALQQRFTDQSAALLHHVLTQSVLALASQNISPPPTSASPCAGFAAIWLQDSTVIALPHDLAQVWPGGSGAAALKVEVRLELQSGQVGQMLLGPGRCHDLKAAAGHVSAQKDELHIADLGYFDLERLRHIDQQGAFFLSRLKVGTHLLDAASPNAAFCLSQQLASLPTEVTQWQREILLGQNARLPVRLLCVRVPRAVQVQREVALRHHAKRKGQKLSRERLAWCGWTVLVTNAPPKKMSLDAALALYGARWQIERLFRLWKETLGLTRWRSHKSQRLLCEVYAKLLAALLCAQLLAPALQRTPTRSWVKGTRLLSALALVLLQALGDLAHGRPPQLTLVHRWLALLPKHAQTQKKKHKPATFQKLQLAGEPLA